ncbi:Uncharacterised protein [Bordetella avium]|nr:Uncharacterised protein [Bordetella avium]
MRSPISGAAAFWMETAPGPCNSRNNSKRASEGVIRDRRALARLLVCGGRNRRRHKLGDIGQARCRRQIYAGKHIGIFAHVNRQVAAQDFFKFLQRGGASVAVHATRPSYVGVGGELEFRSLRCRRRADIGKILERKRRLGRAAAEIIFCAARLDRNDLANRHTWVSGKSAPDELALSDGIRARDRADDPHIAGHFDRHSFPQRRWMLDCTRVTWGVSCVMLLLWVNMTVKFGLNSKSSRSLRNDG